ncbi:ATP-binding cassette domain-containing protein [Microbacterium sp. W1N]|uniref:ABC transporter ATP-binding protein n=1 Tax=Microbacterium festucae TaxID=2977531 RepID=UPI0021C120E5|nr:ATP-binding cassette domain-containing protein [Microbacterium festucae]MCT9818917.1 ATP-binding cassette domain-containing protein [Microbacterium festucae]
MSPRSVPDPPADPPAAAAPAAPPRLDVRGLRVAFGGLVAVDDVSFEVAPGEVVALIGPNGAGKTTVFNAICALVRRRGEVLLDDAPAPGRPWGLAPRGVARTLQGLGLFHGLSVRENVTVPIADRRGAAARADEVLARLRLTAVAERPVAALSYPDRKRVALARALVGAPSLLLLDEPAGGLGADDIAELGAVIGEVAASGCAVLLVEHHVDFVMRVADRIVVLDFGKVIAAGTPEQVRTDPRVEEAYLGRRVEA